MSVMTLIAWLAIQSRAMLLATSALFWWSAPMTLTVMPGMNLAASSAASLAATADPSRVLSALGPPMSVNTPIWTVRSGISAPRTAAT